MYLFLKDSACAECLIPPVNVPLNLTEQERLICWTSACCYLPALTSLLQQQQRFSTRLGQHGHREGKSASQGGICVTLWSALKFLSGPT